MNSTFFFISFTYFTRIRARTGIRAPNNRYHWKFSIGHMFRRCIPILQPKLAKKRMRNGCPPTRSFRDMNGKTPSIHFRQPFTYITFAVHETSLAATSTSFAKKFLHKNFRKISPRDNATNTKCPCCSLCNTLSKHLPISCTANSKKAPHKFSKEHFQKPWNLENFHPQFQRIPYKFLPRPPLPYNVFTETCLQKGAENDVGHNVLDSFAAQTIPTNFHGTSSNWCNLPAMLFLPQPIDQNSFLQFSFPPLLRNISFH